MKPLTDVQLYDFLEKNHDAILQEMILVQKSHDHMTVTRSKGIPRMTAKAITSLLLDSFHLFKSYLKEWTACVTNKNLYLNIPVSYFADLMRQYRQNKKQGY